MDKSLQTLPEAQLDLPVHCAGAGEPFPNTGGAKQHQALQQAETWLCLDTGCQLELQKNPL